MDTLKLRDRILCAIELAVKRHPALEGKVFVSSNSGGWSVAPGVLYADYSSTEAIIVGSLVELIFETYGSAFIKVRPGTLPKDMKPSQLIWHWAPAFYEAINYLDAEQKDILAVLVGRTASTKGKGDRQ